jgi:hypothetical protein
MYAKLVSAKEYEAAVKALKEIRVLAQMLPEGNGATKPKLIDIERL